MHMPHGTRAEFVDSLYGRPVWWEVIDRDWTTLIVGKVLPEIRTANSVDCNATSQKAGAAPKATHSLQPTVLKGGNVFAKGHQIATVRQPKHVVEE